MIEPKRGDYVQMKKINHQQTFVGEPPRGIVIGQTFDPMGSHHCTFKVLWSNGTTGPNVWGEDLVILSPCKGHCEA